MRRDSSPQGDAHLSALILSIGHVVNALANHMEPEAAFAAAVECRRRNALDVESNSPITKDDREQRFAFETERYAEFSVGNGCVTDQIGGRFVRGQDDQGVIVAVAGLHRSERRRDEFAKRSEARHVAAELAEDRGVGHRVAAASVRETGVTGP